MLIYKNYIGIVEYDKDGNIYTGEVIGIRDVITFQGKTPEEVVNSFRDSIDQYIKMCQNDGIQPESPDYGNNNCILSQETSKLYPVEEQQLAEEFIQAEIKWDSY